MSNSTTSAAQIVPTNAPLVLVLVNDYGVSYYYYYVHPIICACGWITNLINTIVLASKRLRTSGPFFQYSLVNSAGAIVAFILLMMLFLTKCGGSVCSISTTYWSQQYTIYAIYYVAYIYYSASAFIQIAIGIQLYLSIKQKLKWLSEFNPYKVSLVIFVFFALLSVLNLFLYQIDPFPLIKLDEKGRVVIERYYYSHLISNQAMVLAGTVIVSLTSYLPFVLLIILNVLIYTELRRVMARRKNMIGPSTGTPQKTQENSIRSAKIRESFMAVGAASSHISNPDVGNDVSIKRLSQAVLVSNEVYSREEQEKKSLRRSLIITLWVSLIFSSDRLVKCVYRSVVLVAPLSPYTYYLNAISYFLDALSYSSFFFVYMYTNKIFKRTFYEIFFRKKSNQIN